ncbi:hypothetical protein QBC47DRAFT_440373 [Echria macrotheca]|uniref:Chitin-binding type-1 domain-containing protein n=1 Tax=Echria macrotheca TaxID=438768 RepID=A0AAJ0BJH1_9PEZI|nr:hypothetical protein QBC47DRAFT_440373 [Echria macrotheca]
MKSMYLPGLAAALLSSTAVLAGSTLDGAGHRILLADVGSHRKNSSSVSLAKLRNQDLVDTHGRLEIRQTAGRCGQQYGRCPSDQCCSDYGYCGDDADHCATLFDCQPQYGVCGWPRTAAPAEPTTTSTSSTPPPPPPTTSTSTSSTPPPPPPTTSTTSRTSTTPPPPAPTTSSTSTPARPTIVPSPTSSAAATPTGGYRVTTNGMCGNGTMCVGSSQFGPCCSQFFWCGSSLDFCGAGCQSQFGACLGVPGLPGLPPRVTVTQTVSVVAPTTVVVTTTTQQRPPTTSSSSTSTSTTPPPPPPPTTSSTTTSAARPTTTAVQLPPGMRSSTDGKCGNGVTCLGTDFGRCCSQFGYCGDGDQFCPPIVGCQPEFGSCDSS